MARPKLPADEAGQVQVTKLAAGKWRARARMRDDSGALVRLTASGGSADEARAALLARVRSASTSTKPLAPLRCARAGV